MRKIALLITLSGLIFLALYLEISSPIEITNAGNITNLLENQKVHVSGLVIKEAQTSIYRTLTLDGNITLYCNCISTPKLKGKQIEALGIIDTYQKTRINVLKIAWK